MARIKTCCSCGETIDPSEAGGSDDAVAVCLSCGRPMCATCCSSGEFTCESCLRKIDAPDPDDLGNMEDDLDFSDTALSELNFDDDDPFSRLSDYGDEFDDGFGDNEDFFGDDDWGNEFDDEDDEDDKY